MFPTSIAVRVHSKRLQPIHQSRAFPLIGSLLRRHRSGYSSNSSKASSSGLTPLSPRRWSPPDIFGAAEASTLLPAKLHWSSPIIQLSDLVQAVGLLPICISSCVLSGLPSTPRLTNLLPLSGPLCLSHLDHVTVLSRSAPSLASSRFASSTR